MMMLWSLWVVSQSEHARCMVQTSMLCIAKTFDEKYNMAKGFIEKHGIIAEIYHGYKHASKQVHVNKEPKNLLVLVWLLWYSIYNETTLYLAKNFLSSDIIHSLYAKVEPKMFKPDWKFFFIIDPINDFAHNYLSVKTILRATTVRKIQWQDIWEKV